MRALVAIAMLAGCNQTFGLDKATPIPTDADLDRDDDGVLDAVDNCIDVKNADQANGDGDAMGDVCDACLTGTSDANNDEDGDDRDDACDGCPAFRDFQVDDDMDGIGNGCDTPPRTTRVRFDPFLRIGPAWSTTVEWTVDERGDVGPLATLPAGDPGLVLPGATLGGDDWLVLLGVTSSRRWMLGDRAGVVVKADNGIVASCTFECPNANCFTELSVDSNVVSNPVPPVPRVLLQLRGVTKGPETELRCIPQQSTALASVATTPGVRHAWTISFVATPALRLTHVDIIR